MLTPTVKEIPSTRATSSVVIASNAKSQTFLFADLAGYTALTEAHGDEAAADTADAFCCAIRRILPDYAAEQVKRIGDAVMIRIPDAGDAVALAVRVVNEISTGHGSLAVRIGMHTGPAVNRDGDWFGAAVNLAARVAAAAQPGEILMTGASYQAAGPAVSSFSVENRDRQSFKNVAAAVAIFALTQPTHLPTDPVCRMAVDPIRAAAVHHFAGSSIHFCGTQCADLFQQHPERYQTVSA
jgi:class 3 adenylate cyclase